MCPLTYPRVVLCHRVIANFMAGGFDAAAVLRAALDGSNPGRQHEANAALEAWSQREECVHTRATPGSTSPARRDAHKPLRHRAWQPLVELFADTSLPPACRFLAGTVLRKKIRLAFHTLPAEHRAQLQHAVFSAFERDFATVADVSGPAWQLFGEEAAALAAIAAAEPSGLGRLFEAAFSAARAGTGLRVALAFRILSIVLEDAVAQDHEHVSECRAAAAPHAQQAAALVGQALTHWAEGRTADDPGLARRIRVMALQTAPHLFALHPAADLAPALCASLAAADSDESLAAAEAVEGLFAQMVTRDMAGGAGGGSGREAACDQALAAVLDRSAPLARLSEQAAARAAAADPSDAFVDADDDNVVQARSLARAFAAAARASMTRLVAGSVPRAQEALRVVPALFGTRDPGVTETASHLLGEILEVPPHAWSQGGREQFAVAAFDALLAACAPPRSASSWHAAVEGADEAATAWREARDQHAAEAVDACFTALGGAVTRRIRWHAEELGRADASAWPQMEATCFVLRCIALPLKAIARDQKQQFMRALKARAAATATAAPPASPSAMPPAAPAGTTAAAAAAAASTSFATSPASLLGAPPSGPAPGTDRAELEDALASLTLLGHPCMREVPACTEQGARLLGAFGALLHGRTALVDAAAAFLTGTLTVPPARGYACHALVVLATRNADHMLSAGHVAPLGATLRRLEQEGVGQEHRSQLYQALAVIAASSRDHEAAARGLSELAAPCAQQLGSRLTAQPLSAVEISALASAAASDAAALAAVARATDREVPPTAPAEAHPAVAVLRVAWPALQRGLQPPWVNCDALCEAVCDAVGRLTEEAAVHARDMGMQVARALVEALHARPASQPVLEALVSAMQAASAVPDAVAHEVPAVFEGALGTLTAAARSGDGEEGRPILASALAFARSSSLVCPDAVLAAGSLGEVLHLAADAVAAGDPECCGRFGALTQYLMSSRGAPSSAARAARAELVRVHGAAVTSALWGALSARRGYEAHLVLFARAMAALALEFPDGVLGAMGQAAGGGDAGALVHTALQAVRIQHAGGVLALENVFATYAQVCRGRAEHAALQRFCAQ